MSSNRAAPPPPNQDVPALLRRIAELEQQLALSEAARQAAGALRAGEGTIRAVVRAIPDLILQVNRAGYVLYFKPSREAAPGMPQGDLVGRDVRDVLPGWAAKNLQHIDRVLQTGEILTT